MKKNKIRKFILLIIVWLTIFSNTCVYANLYQEGLKDPTVNPDSWRPTIEDSSELATKAGAVLSFINVIGIISSVIVLSIMGIKYMLGSLEEKAEYKKAMIPYIIGIILLAACTSIPNIIYNIVGTADFWG